MADWLSDMSDSSGVNLIKHWLIIHHSGNRWRRSGSPASSSSGDFTSLNRSAASSSLVVTDSEASHRRVGWIAAAAGQRIMMVMKQCLL